MGVATLKKVDKRGERRLIAVPELTTRGVTYAKAQVRDLTTQGQRLARHADGRVKQVTGRRTAAWIARASRLAVARSIPSAIPAITASVKVFFFSGRLRVMKATPSRSSYKTTAAGSVMGGSFARRLG